MMYSEEHSYLDDGKATGFIKPYKNGYGFAALLPNEDISLSDYVASVTGKSFIDTIKKAKDIPVETEIPKFSYDYDIEMNSALKVLGMTNPFEPSKADFSALGSSDSGNIFISRVLHKAYIAVDEKGTKAGAATAVETVYAALEEGVYKVTLDRPFVYAVIDDAAGLPVYRHSHRYREVITVNGLLKTGECERSETKSNHSDFYGSVAQYRIYSVDSCQLRSASLERNRQHRLTHKRQELPARGG